MHGHHDIFVRGIVETKKITLTFFDEESQRNVRKCCIPVDYSPGRRKKDKSPLYYFWDFENSQNDYLLSLPPENIVSMEVDDEIFNPKDFVTFWKKIWYIKRDWKSSCKAVSFFRHCFGLNKEPKPKEEGNRRSSWIAE